VATFVVDDSTLTLTQAFSIIESTVEIESVVVKLRNLFEVDHVAYHSSKLGIAPTVDPYLRLTYPASWIKRYILMGYRDVDPVVREGFRHTLPFDWSELDIRSDREAAFLADAAAHGVGGHGFSIPVVSKHGHRGLFTVCASYSEAKWAKFMQARRSALIEVANRLHRRVVVEVFGEDHLRLTERELECLRWVSRGKDTSEIAVILGISTHTVRDYLKSARYKLESATLAQAVGKAINLGLLVL
jgi:LuxR family transcriptional regulator, quorum-sensing system regulator CinR